MGANVIVTNHGKKRSKERLGIRKGIADKVASNALEYGVNRQDIQGRFRRYLDKLFWSHKNMANNLIIYNQRIFVFNGNVLITVMDIPYKFRSVANIICKKNNLQSQVEEDA